MAKFIDIKLEGGKHITLSKRYIIKAEPLKDDKTRLTIDVAIETNDNNYYIADEAYDDLLKRLNEK